MSRTTQKELQAPTVEQLKKEYERRRYKRAFARVTRNIVFTIVVVSAIAVLVAVLFLPVLRIYGNSMNDTLYEGDIVVSVKDSSFETGDIISFYYNNKLLVKRVIGKPGDWIDIDEDGTVYINKQSIDEPYLKEKAFGDCDIDLPYQVPDSRVFVMGDNRATSVDSRSKDMGCVFEEQIVGKIIFRAWPPERFGAVDAE